MFLKEDCDFVITVFLYFIRIHGIIFLWHMPKRGVARTTAQLIYNNAREKIAKALVMGKGLQIEGGNYELCDGSPHCKKCHLTKSYLNQRQLQKRRMELCE